jgi:hypothetical protein
MKRLLCIFLISSFAFSSQAKANQMKDFLVTCATGTAVGALLGLASLAFTEDPGGKVSNVARGASLGLYAGIAFGLVKVYGENQNYESQNLLYFSPMLASLGGHKKIEGAILNYHVLSF